MHMFKKSYPLKDGVVDNTNGITYFGDGNWGVIPNDCSTTGTINGAVNEVGNATRHVWIMNLGAATYSIYPVDSNGNQFYPLTPGTL